MNRMMRRLLDRVRAECVPRIAYRLVLQRRVDPGALEHWRRILAEEGGQTSVLVNSLFYSDEYRMLMMNDARSDQILLNAMHAARCELVRSLPPADVIVDLGGSAPNQARGALLLMGYPHHFEKLLIVDLPPNKSHEQSFAKETFTTVDTERGRVEYVYQDLARLADVGIEPGSVDLVWMGQSVEHITEDEFGQLLPAIHRALRPGGHLCLDTPNRRVTSIQMPDRFIHPDHKIEYFVDDVERKVTDAGFVVEERLGIGLADDAIRTNRFEAAPMIGRAGINDRPDRSYIFYLKARKQ